MLIISAWSTSNQVNPPNGSKIGASKEITVWSFGKNPSNENIERIFKDTNGKIKAYER